MISGCNNIRYPFRFGGIFNIKSGDNLLCTLINYLYISLLLICLLCITLSSCQSGKGYESQHAEIFLFIIFLRISRILYFFKKSIFKGKIINRISKLNYHQSSLIEKKTSVFLSKIKSILYQLFL